MKAIRARVSVLTIQAFALLNLITINSAAQTPGVDPFSSIQHTAYDTVKLSDGGILITLPVRTKAGLIPFQYSLASNSVVSVSQTGQAQIIPDFNGQTSVGLSPQDQHGWLSATTVLCPDNVTQTLKSNGAVFIDGFGTEHVYSHMQIDSKQCLTTDILGGLDQSGLSFSVNKDGSNPLVTDLSGRKITGMGGSLVTDTDLNGNQLYYTSTCCGNPNGWTVTYFDTTLNTPMTETKTFSNNKITTDVHSWTDAAGHSQSFSIAYSPFTQKTVFGCSAMTDIVSRAVNFATSIATPEGQYLISYEPTPGFPSDTTGRISKITFPSGASIQYTYTGGSNGITCASPPMVPVLTRTLTDTTGATHKWIYDTTKVANATVVTDPSGNDTVHTFSVHIGTRTPYETNAVAYQGSRTANVILRSATICYNTNLTNCSTASVTGPITQKDVFILLPGMTQQSQSETKYDLLGRTTEDKEYDYGPTLVSDRLITYGTYSNGTCSVLSFANDRVCTDVTKNATGAVVAQTNNTYDTTGNLLNSSHLASGSTYLNASMTHNANGTPNVVTDVNGAQTTYVSYSCNGNFPTGVSEPLGLSKSVTWDCNGGVETSGAEENSQITSYGYVNSSTGLADPYYRPVSMTDPLGNKANFTYTPTTFESAMNFNGNASTIDILESSDGFGHMMLTQRRQGVGASFFDTTQYTYDASFLIHSVSMPCSANAGQGCSTTVTTTTYDGLSRPSLITDAGGGTVSYSYPANDVLVTAGPAPAGENTKRRQMQYDGLGRLTSVCEITSAAGSGPCAQSSAQTGFWAKYGYDALGNLTSVNQNAQGSPIQTRTFSYDALSRVTSESNPESGTTTYAYDSVNSGGCVLSLPGNMILKTDANGNGDCYGWDALHRLLSIGQSFSSPNAAATPDHCFIYDSAIVNGQTMTKTKGRMAEAYTVAKGAGCGAAKLTDEGLGYDADGRQTDLYQSTPHSAGYYHAAVSYWANNALHTLSGFFASGSTFVPTQTYTPDGEGRWKSVAASSGPNPISNTLYNPASQITALTYGSTDSDSFDYDNAGRMKNYTFKVNGSSEVSAPTWNPNGTLKSLAITADPFNAGNVQTCTYAYDDLARLTSANCGTPWSQTFSYDAFGNISKTGSVSWACATCYNTNKNQYNSTLSPSISYDANGNLLNDSFRTYAWDALGRPVSIGSKTMTYDALGRMVEKFDGAYTQFVYTPAGGLLARTSGQSATSVRVPLPDSWAVYGSGNSFNHYEHLDWLGNSRLSSTQSRTPTTDVAYAPFGEPYASTATSGVSFTGMRSDVAAVSGSVTNGLYDFLEREYPPTQGRWLSPDPAGTGAANPTNPQSWNRYAYVLNNPLTYVDPLGLWHCDWGNGDADPPENQGGASESTCIHDGGDGAGWAPDPGDFSEELVFDGSSIIQGSSDLSSVALGPGESGSASFGSGDFQEGSLAWNVFGPPSAALWSSAANTMNKLTAGYSAAFAGVLAAPALGTATVNIAARATGLYYGLFGSGTGVVLGQYDKYSNYLQAAKSIGANALNVPTRYADFFATRGQWLTLNNSFLQGSILRGQQFFMSSPVLGATGNFAQELQYLTSHGIGPEQWQMVPLPY